MHIRFGAHVNAHTSFDETVYKLQVPTDDPELLSNAMLVLRDWANGITFDGGEIEKERGVVLEEWRRSRGASGRVRDQLLPLTFHESLYAERLPIGTEDSLKGFEPDALRRFYDDWYRPDLMAVIAVGDFDVDTVKDLIEANFADLEPAASPRERVYPPIPEHEETLVGVVTDPEMRVTSVSLMAKYDDQKGETHRSYYEGFVENLAYVMLNERLGDMARTADAPFLGAGAGNQWLSPREAAQSAGAGVVEGGAQRGLEALAVELERARQHGFTAAELARAKAQILEYMEAYKREEATTHSNVHADELVRVYATDESVPGIDYEYRLTQAWVPEISLSEVNGFAATWFGDGSRVLTVSLPDKEGLVAPTEAELLAVLDRVKTMSIEPPLEVSANAPLLAQPPTPGSVVSVREVLEIGAEVWTLSNGVEVWVKQTAFRSDQLLFGAFSPGGSELIPTGEHVPAVSAVSVANSSGLGAHDATTLPKLLAGTSASVSPYIGGNWEGIHGSTSPTDLETALQLAHLWFTQPRLTNEGLALNKRNRANALANRLNSPGAWFSDAWTRLVWADHPRRLAWTVDTLDQMDAAASRSFFEGRMADANDFTWVFVGNLDVDALKAGLETYVASLPSAEGSEVPGDDGVRMVPGVVSDTVRAGIDPKASVRITFHGDVDYSRDARHAMRSLNEWAEVRLREELREELGGTYGVSASGSMWNVPYSGYSFTVSFQCDPERVEELEAAAWAVLRDMRQTAPDEAMVEQIKAKQRRSHEVNLNDNAWWKGAIVASMQRGEEPAMVASYGEVIEGLTAERVHEAAQTWLDESQYARLVLLPAE